MKTGIFLDGSVSGVHYKTEHYRDELQTGGIYHYEDGDTITFSIGGIALGSAKAKPYLSTLDLVAETTSRLQTVSHYVVTNAARLLLSVGEIRLKQDLIFAKYRYELDFCLEPQVFEQTEVVKKCVEELGIALISVEKTRNIVRRCAKGIYKETDVRIPTKNGHDVLADIYRPLIPGKYPVVLSMGAFGKSFVNGVTVTPEDEAYFDMVEDRFYGSYGDPETKHLLQGAFFKRMAPCFGSALPIPRLEGEPVHPDGPPPCLVPVSNVFEQATADDWVPYGYVVINIEEYGIGANPGQLKQFGAENAEDYCDVIEWAAEQEWSSGKVGLFGASYYAMTQYLAAQRHPKGLAAMIPIMGDYDSYRHYIYSGGGLFNRADNMDIAFPNQKYTFMDRAMEEPFWDERIYGPEGEYMSSADISEIDYPIWPVVEPDASLHGLGSSEAYINCASKAKKMLLVNGAGIHFWMYGKEYMERFRAFFDYWLKGEENGIMDEKPVALQIRGGNGTYRWRYEEDWPVPGTEYRKLYLDASADGMSAEKPYAEGQVTYSADVQRSETRRVAGATFVTAPMKEDVEIAGYIKAGLYVSSTTEDMEIHLSVRVLDENGQEVIYPSHTSMERGLPLGFGSMKVSHRKLDETQSRPYHPVYLHTREAYQPLTPGEPVYCEVGTFPTTGLVRKGWRIVLEIDPVSNRWVDYKEEAYRNGSENTIYCGGDRASFLQIPVLPAGGDAI